MNEIEEIRKRKMEELQQRYSENVMQQANEDSQVQHQLHQIETAVKSRMSKDAFSRYSNIKAADPEKASQLLLLLAQFLQSGKLSMINDDVFRDILVRVTPKKREMKINRV